MKKRCSQHRAGASLGQGLVKVFGLSCTTRCDHRNSDAIRNRTREFNIVTVLGAVAVHAGQENLSCSESLSSRAPFNRIQCRRTSAAVRIDFPTLAWIVPIAPASVD